MKIGRNEPCPCGSGKKYKRCCIGHAEKQHADIVDDFEQMAAMNPNLSIDDLNIVLEKKMQAQNNRPLDNFCGLSPNQINNWMHAPFTAIKGVNIHVPKDIQLSPVMRYLALMLDAIIEQGGALKATAKGNLPSKLVKQASAMLPEFAVAPYNQTASISEFSGSNEDKMNALHYSRILAEISGIIHFKNGQFTASQQTQKLYQQQGVAAFFYALLEAATKRYNWGYFDCWSDESSLNSFWVYMLWRLQSHGSLKRLVQEVDIAFPMLKQQMPNDEYFSQEEQLALLIDSRFANRFLQFWGFIVINPKRFDNGQPIEPKIMLQPLLGQTLEFLV